MLIIDSGFTHNWKPPIILPVRNPKSCQAGLFIVFLPKSIYFINFHAQVH